MRLTALALPNKNHASKQFPTKTHSRRFTPIPVLAAERHHQILTRARQNGTVRTADLAKEFGVAEETIRRDLELLTKRGHLTRTHGGAIDPTAPLVELSHHERAGRQTREKGVIARHAAALAQPGETVVVDASSTALALAAELPPGLRVATYSLAIVERLANRTDLELIQLGGAFNSRGRYFDGLLTENGIRALRVDRFFFSGRGFDPAAGISDPNPDQARLKALLIERAAWSCALIDSTKLGLRSDYFFAQPDAFDVLITDADAKPYLRQLKNPPFEVQTAS